MASFTCHVFGGTKRFGLNALLGREAYPDICQCAAMAATSRCQSHCSRIRKLQIGALATIRENRQPQNVPAERAAQ